MGPPATQDHKSAAIDPIDGMCVLKFNFDEQITRCSIPGGTRTLTGEANVLTPQDPLGYLHVEHALLRHQSTLGIDLWDTQGERPGSAEQRRLEIEQHFCMMIFATSRMECAASAARTGSRLRAEIDVSKKSLYAELPGPAPLRNSKPESQSGGGLKSSPAL